MSNQRLIIIGFMASGKTTVANAVARRLDCSAIDLDELITLRERRTPQEIIEQDGEEEFRRVETGALRKLLNDASVQVIALGGGAWTIAENRELIAQHGALTVWLDADFELCWKRIEAGSQLRPLARSREMAQQLYSERRAVYELAEATVTVSERESAAEIATKVSNEILRRQ
jgi:shikimate kinase